MSALIKGTEVTDGGSVTLKATEGGLLIAVPPQIIWTAKGYGFQAMATSAIAGLVVRPSTTAAATLYNKSTTKLLIIERVMVHQLVSGTAQSMFGLWLCSHPAGMVAPTNDITVRNSTNGGSAGGSDTIFDNGATVADDGWFPWGDWGEVEATGVLPGCQLSAEIGGRIIIPPTGALSAHVVAGTVDEDFTIGFHWFEIPITELTIS